MNESFSTILLQPTNKEEIVIISPLYIIRLLAQTVYPVPNAGFEFGQQCKFTEFYEDLLLKIWRVKWQLALTTSLHQFLHDNSFDLWLLNNPCEKVFSTIYMSCSHHGYIINFTLYVSCHFLQSALHCSCFISFSSIRTLFLMFHLISFPFLSFNPLFIDHVSFLFSSVHSPSHSFPLP